MDIRALNESARKVHGADITILVARATAWGNDDNLILISGKKHLQAATDIARLVLRQGKKPILEEERTEDFIGGGVRISTSVRFA